MNVNQLITMAMRLIARKAVNRGVHADAHHMTKRGTAKGQSPTPAQQRSAQASQRKLRQGVNIARRFTKF